MDCYNWTGCQLNGGDYRSEGFHNSYPCSLCVAELEKEEKKEAEDKLYKNISKAVDENFMPWFLWVAIFAIILIIIAGFKTV